MKIRRISKQKSPGEEEQEPEPLVKGYEVTRGRTRGIERFSAGYMGSTDLMNWVLTKYSLPPTSTQKKLAL